jgi:branched-subunit amino acid ABC-type transport system permease component
MWGTLVAAVLVSGSIYGVIGFGFALARRVSGIFNLAHGALLVLAAYLNYGLQNQLLLPEWLSVLLAIILAATASVLLESVVIPVLRRLSLGDVELLVVSWLILIVTENVIAIGFSNSSIYLGPAGQISALQLGSFRLTHMQVLTLLSALLTGATLFVFFRSTRLGKSASAVGDDPRLALIVGIDVTRVRIVTSLMSGLLTAGAGVLLSYQERIDPRLGMRFSIVAVIATLSGQALGPSGALLGGLLLASCEALVLYLFNPALRNGVVYGLLVLILYLSFRSKSISPALSGRPGR